MQRDDSKENQQAETPSYQQIGRRLFGEIVYDLMNLRDSLDIFRHTQALDVKIKEAANETEKKALISEYEKIIEQYSIKLKLAKEAYAMILKEKREEVFSAYPALSHAKKVLEYILATEADFKVLRSQVNSQATPVYPQVKNPEKGSQSIHENQGDYSNQNLRFTNDTISEILTYLNLPDLVNMRLVSKQHKKLVNDLLTKPETVIKVIDSFHTISAMEFIDFYTQSDQYKKLREKFDKSEKLKPVEIIVIALTTPNIYNLKTEDLDIAIAAMREKKVLSPELEKNLSIIRNLIELKELAGDLDVEEIKKYTHRIEVSFNYFRSDSKYFNLQGADISNFFWFQNLASTNFKNAKLPLQAGVLNFFALGEFAFSSSNNMLRQLNQLQKMIINRPPKEQRELQKLIIDDCYRFCNDYVDKNGFTDKERLKVLIKVLEVLEKHPLTKKTFARNVSDFFGSSALYDDDLERLKKKIKAHVQEKPSRNMKKP